MAFNALAPLDRLVTILQNADMVTAGLQKVYKGVPESLENKMSAYVFIGPMKITDKAGGLLQRDLDYYVHFAYRVTAAESTAENVMAAVLDAFITEFYQERVTALNGTVVSCAIDLTRASREAYDVFAGQEFRIYPVTVETTQQATV